MDKQELACILEHRSREEVLDCLDTLGMTFDVYSRKVVGSGEIVDVLIDFSFIAADEEIVDALLDVISAAHISQDLRHINYGKISDNLGSVSEKFLPRYIDILSYSHDVKYLPAIIGFKNHRNSSVQQAVNDALSEMGQADSLF